MNRLHLQSNDSDLWLCITRWVISRGEQSCGRRTCAESFLLQLNQSQMTDWVWLVVFLFLFSYTHSWMGWETHFSRVKQTEASCQSSGKRKTRCHLTSSFVCVWKRSMWPWERKLWTIWIHKRLWNLLLWEDFAQKKAKLRHQHQSLITAAPFLQTWMTEILSEAHVCHWILGCNFSKRFRSIKPTKCQV